MDQFVSGALVCRQVSAELVEAHTPPPLTTATSLSPVAEAATAVQLLLGALLSVQTPPVLVET